MALGALSNPIMNGSFNVCIGSESGGSVLNGNKNILIGYKAGNNIIDGSKGVHEISDTVQTPASVAVWILR